MSDVDLATNSDTDINEWDEWDEWDEMPFPAATMLNLTIINITSDDEPPENEKQLIEGQVETAQSSLTEPIASYRATRFLRWIRMGLALFMILTALATLTGCATASVVWKPVTSVLAIEEFVQLNHTVTSLPPMDVQQFSNQVTAWQVPTVKTHRLVIVNYSQVSDLCGSLGCLYAIVHQVTPEKAGSVPMRLIYQAYLNPNLPEERSLFALSNEPSEDELPCLTVNQLKSNYLLQENGKPPEALEVEASNAPAVQLQQLELCYDGNQYRVAGGRVLPTGV